MAQVEVGAGVVHAQGRDLVAFLVIMVLDLFGKRFVPEQQQTLLQLRDIEGMEYEEIAGVTGLEVNAIRVNISRARKKLRETLTIYKLQLD